MFRQDLQEHARVKTGHDDLGRPVAEAVGHDDVEPADVEEGEEEQGGGLVLHEPDIGVVQLGHVGNKVGMGKSHSFWPACCARAVWEPTSGGWVNRRHARFLIVAQFHKRREGDFLMIQISLACHQNLVS